MENAGLINQKKNEEQKVYTLFDPDQKITFLQKFRLFFVKTQFSVEDNQIIFYKILGNTVFHLETVRAFCETPKSNNINIVDLIYKNFHSKTRRDRSRVCPKKEIKCS